jgi:hypothetical protein
MSAPLLGAEKQDAGLVLARSGSDWLRARCALGSDKRLVIGAAQQRVDRVGLTGPPGSM